MIKHKKVELTELFYDLVYVYAISQITKIIHHTHHGFVSGENFWIFSLCLVVFINSWMVQTVYTNRFGKNSLTNILFMLVQMILLLISVTAITTDFQATFIPVILPMSGMSALLLLQYVVTYFQVDNTGDKIFIERFFYILSARTLGLFISAFLPFKIGFLAAVISVVFSWVVPGLTLSGRHEFYDEAPTSLNFPHLVERLSLLVIIIFGEMIIGIAPYFKIDNLSIWSVLIFFIVADLFMSYIVEIDHLIDTEREERTGIRAMYYHYFIFFGLSFTTVSLSFLEMAKADSNDYFTVGLLYLGVGLVLLGTLLHNVYNKETHAFGKSLVWRIVVTYLAGLLASLAMASDRHAVIAISFVTTLTISIVMVHHNISRSREL